MKEKTIGNFCYRSVNPNQIDVYKESSEESELMAIFVMLSGKINMQIDQSNPDYIEILTNARAIFNGTIQL